LIRSAKGPRPPEHERHQPPRFAAILHVRLAERFDEHPLLDDDAVRVGDREEHDDREDRHEVGRRRRRPDPHQPVHRFSAAK
jgi:hypothetical protein